jgi:hypothetical protein
MRWAEEGIRAGTSLAIAGGSAGFAVVLIASGTVAFRRLNGAEGDCAHTDGF